MAEARDLGSEVEKCSLAAPAGGGKPASAIAEVRSARKSSMLPASPTPGPPDTGGAGAGADAGARVGLPALAATSTAEDEWVL